MKPHCSTLTDPANLRYRTSNTKYSRWKLRCRTRPLYPRPRKGVIPVRTKLLVLASSVGMLGWGTVLPYQYAYAANTRGWGALAAALASTLFSVGALVAAPFAGRLSDRFDPVVVAVVAKLVAAAGVGSLVWAD